MGNIIEYAFLSQDAYKDNASAEYLPEGWTRLEEVHNRESGYDAVVYKNTLTNEIVVAHRGTEFGQQPTKDLFQADGSIAFGNIPQQVKDGSLFVDEIKKKYGIMPTNVGHSLGGFIADLVTKRQGGKAITFDQPSLPSDKYNRIWEELFGSNVCPTSNTTMVFSAPNMVNVTGNPKGTIIKLEEFIPQLKNSDKFLSSDDLGSLVYASILQLSFGPLSILSPTVRDIDEKIINSIATLNNHYLDKTMIPALLKYVKKYGDPTTFQNFDVDIYIKNMQKRIEVANSKAAEDEASRKALKDAQFKYKTEQENAAIDFAQGKVKIPELKSVPKVKPSLNQMEEKALKDAQFKYKTEQENAAINFAQGKPKIPELQSALLVPKSKGLVQYGKYGETFLSSGK